jgi:hypothetical protein
LKSFLALKGLSQRQGQYRKPENIPHHLYCGPGHGQKGRCLIAWAWLRHQPHSKLSQWFSERFAGGGTRMKRIGIVAVARRLLVDLWRFLEYGVIPEGALLTT